MTWISYHIACALCRLCVLVWHVCSGMVNCWLCGWLPSVLLHVRCSVVSVLYTHSIAYARWSIAYAWWSVAYTRHSVAYVLRSQLWTTLIFFSSRDFSCFFSHDSFLVTR